MPRIGSFMALNEQASEHEVEEELTPILERAVEQMEFYFTGFNMEKDKYIYDLYNSSKNHMIDVSVFMNFNRIKQLEITPDDLLFACSKSDKLVVDEENRKIGRKVPFKKDVTRNLRILRISKIPKTMEKSEIKKYFDCNNNPWISMQYHYNKSGDERTFNGTIIVEFEKEEEAQKFLKNPPAIDGEVLSAETMESFQKRNRRK